MNHTPYPDPEPIGYTLKPTDLGWTAYLLRKGDNDPWIPIARGRHEPTVRRRARRELKRARRVWAHQRGHTPRNYRIEGDTP